MPDNDDFKKQDVENTVRRIDETMRRFGLGYDESLIVEYVQEDITAPFMLLSQYDSKNIELPASVPLEDGKRMIFANEEEWIAKAGREFYKLQAEIALKLVKFITEKFEENHGFGIEREPGALAGIIGNLYQTFGEQELYPTPMSKAANLLYLVIKNHPFVNGNKRIGVFLFCIFMEMHVYKLVGDKIRYSALPAIALLIANSDPKDKDLIVDFLMGLFK